MNYYEGKGRNKLKHYRKIQKAITLNSVLLFVGLTIIPTIPTLFSPSTPILAPIDLIVNDDGSGDPTDNEVDVPAYLPGSGITPTLTFNFTILGTNSSETTTYYGDDPWEDWQNISITGDILYPVNEMTLAHVGTKGDWMCDVTPTKPGGDIVLRIDWPGNGSANQTIDIINGTNVHPTVDSFPWGSDFTLIVMIQNMDGDPLKYAKVCLLWEEEDDEFNATEGENKVGNGANGEYWFWIRQEDQGTLPPKNITIAAQTYPGSPCWGYGHVLMERPKNPPLVYVDDDYNITTPGWGYNHFNIIQDGTNAVETNGTVLVNNGIYPENILIDKSLNLIGEDKNSTILHGDENGSGINITADNVTVSGFTIQNYTNGYGILLSTTYNHITDTIISDCIGGIIIFFYWYPYQATSINTRYEGLNLTGYNTVTKNTLIRNRGVGISVSGKNNTIFHNRISQSEYGIMAGITESNNITQNTISDNGNGILIMASYDTKVYQNIISNNEELGVFDFCTSRTLIRQNNFMENGRHAYFNQAVLLRARFFNTFLDFPITRSIWEENYWEKTRILPFFIPGLVSLTRGFVTDPPYHVNFFQLDRYPAQEPYNILEAFYLG